MSADYQSELLSRPRRKRRLFWPIFISAVLLLIAAGGSFYALRNLSWFRVTDFKVAGTSLPSEDVLKAVQVSETGGGLRGFLGPENIFFWQFNRTPNVSLALPLVASLSVESDLFARTVQVKATDRTLWAVVCEGDGASCYAVDDTGIVFASVPDTEGVLILKITDGNDRTLVLGEPVLPEPAWVQNLMSVLNVLQTSGYQVASVRFDDFGTRTWHAVLASGLTMDFSFDFTPDDFRSVLALLKTKIDITKTTDVDFSVPQRIYYK